MSGEPEETPRSRHIPASEGISIALASTLATSAVVAFAFNPARAGEASMLSALGSLYAVLTVVALVRISRQGELRHRFRPLGGDMSLGAITAGALYGAARLVEHALAAHGTPREAWLVRIYLQLGDPEAANRQLVGGFVFLIAAMEEIVWRGLVMRSLEDALGERRAWLVTSLLYAIAHVPTLFLLRDPTAGLNPFIVIAAFGCGLVWGGIVLRTGRLVPAIFAHALFSWSIVEFPIWRP